MRAAPIAAMVAAITCLAGPAMASGSTAARAPRAVASTTSTLFTSVSCASTAFCFAVGTTYFGPNRSHQKPVAERWNGKTWSVVPTPTPTGTKNSVLTAVSCTTATDCTAVGSSSPTPLAEHWNGKAWSIVPVAKPVAPNFATLSAVACTNTKFCIAVGSQAAKNAPLKTLTEQWNGSTWSVTVAHETAVSGLAGLGTIDHVFPFQRSATAFSWL